MNTEIWYVVSMRALIRVIDPNRILRNGYRGNLEIRSKFYPGFIFHSKDVIGHDYEMTNLKTFAREEDLPFFEQGYEFTIYEYPTPTIKGKIIEILEINSFKYPDDASE